MVSQNADSIAKGVLKFISEPALKKFYENRYTAEDNMKDEREYAEKWDKLLSGIEFC